MRKHIVMTAMGPDRPGLVDAIAQFLAERDANIQGSRMAILGGEFAVILLFAADADAARRIEADRDELARRSGLTIVLKETSEKPAPKGATIPYEVRAVSIDHPGIVHAVAHALAKLGVNVATLRTWTSAAPVTGTPIFSMHLEVQVPAELPGPRLREALERIGREAGIDLEVRPARL